MLRMSGREPREEADMAIASGVLCGVLALIFGGMAVAIPIRCKAEDFAESYSLGEKIKALIIIVACVAVVIGLSLYAGVSTYKDQVMYEADPEGYSLERAQRGEGYYKIIALEDNGSVQILEDPNTGGLYSRRETGSGKSRAVEMVPLLNKDGTPMTVEDWKAVTGRYPR